MLAPGDGPDRRTDPAVKGPDLAMLTGLRLSAAARGADEVVLLSGAGTVLEGALSALLWWRGDVLCMPPLDLPVLPSVTRRLLTEIAVAAGTEVRLRGLPAGRPGRPRTVVGPRTARHPAGDRVVWRGPGGRPGPPGPGMAVPAGRSGGPDRCGRRGNERCSIGGRVADLDLN